MNLENPPLRVIFAGTPEFSLQPLQILLDIGCDIVAVLTQPDRRAGRGKQLRASPVKQLALEHGLEVLQPKSLREADWQEKLGHLRPDLMVVVAYGLMIPSALLTLPRLGCWNIHASLLPRWRGAAPIHRAIEAGDEQTGVCIMQMDATLDTGPVYHSLGTQIEPGDTSGSLHDRLAALGAKALAHCVERAMLGELPEPKAQDHTMATYAHKLSKAEAELDWNLSADVLHRKVKAFNPWPVAWCMIGNHRLRVWEAEVADINQRGRPGQVITDGHRFVVGTTKGSLNLLEVQLPGGQRMPARAFLNAHDPESW